MSVLIERSMGELNEERKQVYPLFQKGAKPRKDPTLKTADGFAVPDAGNTKKAKKTKADAPKAAGSGSSSSSTTNVPGSSDRAELLDVDPNSGRRKRQKTGAPKPAIEGSEDQNEAPRVAKRQSGQRKVPGAEDPQNFVDPDARKPLGHIDLKGDEHPNDSLQETFAIRNTNGLPTPSNILMEDPTSSRSSPRGGEKKLDVSLKVGENGVEDGLHLAVPDTKQKKVLRLNPKTGTIGSPPSKKLPPATEAAQKKAAGPKKQVKSKIIVIAYGEGQRLSSAVGEQIDQILNNSRSGIAVSSKLPPKPEKKGSPAKAPKALHPLFMGKVAMKKASSQKPHPKDSDIIALTQAAALERPQSRGRPSPTKTAPTLVSGFGPRPQLYHRPASIKPAFSAFGTSSNIVKFPGAIEPAWPWKGMVHVRGIELNELNSEAEISNLHRTKKSKYHAIEVSTAESIIESIASDLCIKEVIREIREINPDEYPSVPACLRLPIKHNESWLSIQKCVLKELRIRPTAPRNPADESSDEDEIRAIRTQPSSYPASLFSVYSAIGTSFSAFDYGQCETQTWTMKYAPKSADEVLQAGAEARILKSWLQALTVSAVEGGLGNQSASRASSTSRHSKGGKRKRKPKKLDDFIVSTDEEDNEMDEITEPESDVSPHGKQSLPKTVLRAGDAKENAVVISGPHGCGKTAAVYAVAKELGFEVFEINSSSRRNGKDIWDKVGDMTRNHQVQRSHDVPGVDSIGDDNERIDNALADDLKSGRQGTMNSFLKPKQELNQNPKPKTKAKTKTAAPSKKSAKTRSALYKPAAKQQKQSLILIEEVDVLYKEDTQFWATILELLETSKRPIIMTCNDESAIPIASLKVHAIIRLAPPPIDLAVDYLLLVAACEGHVLQREAITSLYEGRGLDLRASLTELNFWCQFAVGDVQRGMDWYYPRWTRGKDVDEKGDTIRVVSYGTYQTGMGWLSQDFLESHAHHLAIEEEMLHEAYDGWHIEASDAPAQIKKLEIWAKKTRGFSDCKKDNKAALDMYTDFAEALSSADICSSGMLAPENHIALDFTLPDVTQKVKEDYPLGHDLLEATPLVSYDNLGKDIYFWIRSRARNHFQVDQHVNSNFEVPTELDPSTESDVLKVITTRATLSETSLNRKHLALAFDPIAEPEKRFMDPTNVELCSFDRTISLITEDIAPYIRSIVAYDSQLQQGRTKLSNLLSEGGRPGKRMRTTRAAMSALEGGTRKSTRRDRWFSNKVNPYYVMRTGMQSWSDAAVAEMKMATGAATAASPADENESNEDCE